MTRSLRVLLVDNADHTMPRALGDVLAIHQVDVARDALDALQRIDCASRPYDVILCDADGGGVLPGPLLWAYLRVDRKPAADRLILVEVGPISHATRLLLARAEAPCADLCDVERVMAQRLAPFGTPHLVTHDTPMAPLG